ncbi:MAG: hypothetical protein WC549_01850 [Actinomycetota bacterium]
MTLLEVRTVINMMSGNAFINQSISDAEQNLLIYIKMQEIAKQLNDNGYEFYKENVTFSQSYSGFGLVDKVPYSAEIFIYKLISAYMKDSSDNLYPISIQSVEGVHSDTLNQEETGSVAFSNAAFYVHPPTAVTGDYNLYCTIYNYPQMPADDNSVVNVPPQFLNYLIALCRYNLYSRSDMPIPKSVNDEITENQYKIINKA